MGFLECRVSKRAVAGVLATGLGCGPELASREPEDRASGDESRDGGSTTVSPSDRETEGRVGPPGVCEAAPPKGAFIPEASLRGALAAAYCLALERCACDLRRAGPSSSCRHVEAMAWDDRRAQAQALGLRYDGACVGHQIAAIESLGCSVASKVNPLAAEVLGPGRCGAYHGDVERGGPCQATARGMSTCRQGLACWRGRCVDPCREEAFGERLRPFNFACAPGQRVARDETCQEPAVLFDVCDREACTTDAYCRSNVSGDAPAPSTCAPRLALGANCLASDRGCASLWCVEGRCAVGPIAGQACDRGGCARGHTCRGGTCEVGERPAICAWDGS